MSEDDAEEENVLKDLEAVMDKDTVENFQRSVSRETSPRKRGQSERKDSGTTGKNHLLPLCCPC